MLMLGLKAGEEVIVHWRGQRMRVCVGKVDRSVARLGFEAPDEVVILRGEVEQRILAAGGGPTVRLGKRHEAALDAD